MSGPIPAPWRRQAPNGPVSEDQTETNGPASKGRAEAGGVHASVRQAASLLLLYPGDDWPQRIRLVEQALAPLPGPAAPLREFCTRTGPADPLQLAADYVSTFDRSRRRTLHMTYYLDGDTRRRGASLARIKELYRAHGWLCGAEELPDFLPLMLEFSARCPGPGERLLGEHAPGLRLLASALEHFGSPYADVLGAVLSTLPEPTPAQLRRVRAVAEAGPPTESVGLAPYPPTAGHAERGAHA
ncbi:nitrate reductase molybdenum cofactor assembly chaperone [Sphaerisporangium fuscum]|uniref:nitrate reductase molybdenum cofactor assembly chaperone n=1 Tax=Sphaerisporangium fuscum TaxID=2835868 RepID=UPI001BDD6353|nr:nitrate reductase molybdenum cofactor assembly chaperone [Sphaerisporangium fuscum]